MASEEHKMLAQYLKEVHSNLRKSSFKYGPETAWSEHLKNTNVLSTYAEYMKTLATSHWEANSEKEVGSVICRIKWTANFCYDYFILKTYVKYREKDIDIAQKNNIIIENDNEHYEEPVHLLDVGSCYNPFKKFDYLDVFAVDLCPANDTVMQCDFLNVSIGSTTIVENKKVIQLKTCSFDVVAFCFLLEYIPDSNLRIKACKNAYDLLTYGGVLIINTPDSKHVGANSKIMKCWRYTLACMGFSRIKYEKFKHMHCIAFRKTLHKDIGIRWSKIYKEPYMTYAIHIPQDYQDIEDCPIASTGEASFQDFQELPFCYSD